MSITTDKNGRLCNQIIRNLSLSLIAEKHDLYIQYSSHNRIKRLGIKLFIGNKKYKDTLLVDNNNYFNILNMVELDKNIDGNKSYFQTREITNLLYQHISDNKNDIIDINPYRDRYNNNNDCFIHIRLGDATKWNPGIDYYIKCLELLNFTNLYIASDDLNNEMILKLRGRYKSLKIIDYDEIKTIQFGSTCKYIILSHGSYSAIIGYLSFFSDIYYKKYELGKLWYGDMFSINKWNVID